MNSKTPLCSYGNITRLKNIRGKTECLFFEIPKICLQILKIVISSLKGNLNKLLLSE